MHQLAGTGTMRLLSHKVNNLERINSQLVKRRKPDLILRWSLGDWCSIIVDDNHGDASSAVQEVQQISGIQSETSKSSRSSRVTSTSVQYFVLRFI